jgi:hypothetical protein
VSVKLDMGSTRGGASMGTGGSASRVFWESMAGSVKHIFLEHGGTIMIGWGSEGDTDRVSNEVSMRKGSASHQSGI